MKTFVRHTLQSASFACLVIFFTGITHVTRGQVGTYRFSAGSVAVSEPQANATFTNVTRTGLTAATGSNVFNSTGWSTGTSYNGLTSYVEFKVTPAAGYALNLTSLSFTGVRDANGPRQLRVAYDATGTNTFTTNFTNLNPTMQTNFTWDFTDFPYQGTTGVTFRIYGWDATSSGSFSIDDVVLNGFVLPAPTCRALTNGTWDGDPAPSPWSCPGGPVSGSVIEIPAGITVQVDNATSLSNVTLNVYGTLNFASGGDNINLTNNSAVNVFTGGVVSGPNNNGNYLTINDVIVVYKGNPNSADGTGDVYGPKYCNQNGCGATIIPLPITLVQFTAAYEADNEQVRLNWITASEINNRTFTVERSTDLVHFEAIAHLPGAGLSRERRAYVTYDGSPMPGISYYRLKQTDYNGKSTLSKPVAVQTSEPASALALWPNPSNGQEVNIRVDADLTRAIVSLYSATGKKVYDRELVVGSEGRLVFPQSLTGGIYLLKIVNGAQVFTQKFFVSTH